MEVRIVESYARDELVSELSKLTELTSDAVVVCEGDGTIYDFALPDLLEIVTYQPGDQISFRCVEKTEEAATVTVSDLL